MAITEVPAEARPAVRLRRRREIDELDYRRELRRLTERGYSQRQVAGWLGISQPALSSALRTAARVAMPAAGFSGASPLEICQRYAAGLIERALLVDELTRWVYAPRDHTDGDDPLTVDREGTWADVEFAAGTGLIEDEVYDEVFRKRTAGH